MGNVEGAFVDLFNQLGRLRGRYRYDAQVSDPMAVTEDDLALVALLLESYREALQRRDAKHGNDASS